MGIISIGDLEVATGTTITDEDVPKTEWMIETVSAYIETYTGRTFSKVIDKVIRCQADAYGIISFEDLLDVSEVVGFGDSSDVSCWRWDGMDSIYGLTSFQVVDATVTYGCDEPPTDIAGICAQLCATGLELPLGGNVESLRVGDVETKYAVTVGTGGVTISPSGLMMAVLDAYRTRNYTMRLGSIYFPPSVP